jgi:hypothetical protein
MISNGANPSNYMLSAGGVGAAYLAGNTWYNASSIT